MQEISRYRDKCRQKSTNTSIDGRYKAGSVTNLMDCMKAAVSMGIPLETAVRCAIYNPAKSIGVENLHGRIAPGAYGDCVLLSREDLAVKKVIQGER